MLRIYTGALCGSLLVAIGGGRETLIPKPPIAIGKGAASAERSAPRRTGIGGRQLGSAVSTPRQVSVERAREEKFPRVALPSSSGAAGSRGKPVDVADRGQIAASPLSVELDRAIEWRSGSIPSQDDILAGWGGNDPALDLNDDGMVNGMDLAIALAQLVSEDGGSAAGGESDDAPMLTAGLGFLGETPEPAPAGSPESPGHGSRAIARWNFVPHQSFGAPFRVGVVAFHAFGIDRVEFSVHGGSWTSVAEPTYNPDTQTVEYWVWVDPAQLPAGEAEIRAVVHPLSGRCRVLGGALENPDAVNGEHGMFFVADSAAALPSPERYVSPDGSDSLGDGSAASPFATIMKACRSIADASGGKADGGVVYLMPGEHNYGGYTYALQTPVEDCWVTIRPAPGVDSAAAPIVAATTGGTRMKLVRFQEVTFIGNAETNSLIPTTTGTLNRVWLDRCSLLGGGAGVVGNWLSGWDNSYITDTFATHCQHGFWGADLQRNVHLGLIGSDAFTNAKLVIGSRVDDIVRGNELFHPDFFMIYAAPGTPIENIIMYGCRCDTVIDSQGPFSKLNPLFDIAMVGIHVDTRFPGAVGKAFQFGGPIQHMLVADSQILGPAIWRTQDPGFDTTDVVFRNVIWSGEGPTPAGLAGVMTFGPDE